MTSRADLASFLKLPWRIYGADPSWVPPLLRDDRAILDPGGPFFEHAEGALLVGLRDKEPVGRVVAIREKGSAEPDVGTIGYFECIDDEAVARALLNAAADWLGERGTRRIRGPISPSLLLGRTGMLVGGEPGRPTIMMSYNPPYYPKLWAACGYEKAHDLVAYWQTLSDFPQRVLDEGESIRKELERAGMRIRPFRKTHLNADARTFVELHNRAYEHYKHYAHSPGTEREARLLAEQLRDVLDGDLFLFIERDGKAVGMSVAMPDASPVLQALDGRLGPIRLFKALRAMKRMDAFRIADIAVAPEEQGQSIAYAISCLVISNARAKGYQRVEYSWILEDNVASRKTAERAGARVARTYRIFERSI